jgi:hypothetical protein
MSVLQRLHETLTGIKSNRQQLETGWKKFQESRIIVEESIGADEDIPIASLAKHSGPLPHKAAPESLRKMRATQDKYAKEIVDKASTIRRFASIMKLKKDILLHSTKPNCKVDPNSLPYSTIMVRPTLIRCPMIITFIYNF